MIGECQSSMLNGRSHSFPGLFGAFDLQQLAKATDGFTGSEIEQVFIEALYRAFDQDSEPTDLTIGHVLVEFVPLSKLMAEQLGALRSWAKGRSRPATTPGVERKLAA
jgi:SpoVK/Ycf46/Vps4 family AAA+-type ATPase